MVHVAFAFCGVVASLFNALLCSDDTIAIGCGAGRDQLSPQDAMYILRVVDEQRQKSARVVDEQRQKSARAPSPRSHNAPPRPHSPPPPRRDSSAGPFAPLCPPHSRAVECWTSARAKISSPHQQKAQPSGWLAVSSTTSSAQGQRLLSAKLNRRLLRHQESRVRAEDAESLTAGERFGQLAHQSGPFSSGFA
jgi:hypothetical protein